MKVAVKQRRRNTERVAFHPGFTPQMLQWSVLGQSQVRNLQLSLSLPHACQVPEEFGHLPLLSPGHYQGAGYEVEQPGLELEPLWDDCFTGAAALTSIVLLGSLL